jgi:hypothetical protein
MRRFLTVAFAGLMLLAVAAPAFAHPRGSSGGTSNARRDHFVEHLLNAEMRIDPNFEQGFLFVLLRDDEFDDDFANDGNAEGDLDIQRRFCIRNRPRQGSDVLTDLNQVEAQTDLDGDGDVDSDDDEFLVAGICYYFITDVVRGQDNGTFGERRPTRRDQGASLTARWVDLNNDFSLLRDGDFPEKHVTDYSDVPQQNAHSGPVWWLSEGGGGFVPPIFRGYPDGTFRPAGFVLNQHAGAIENRLADNFGG